MNKSEAMITAKYWQLVRLEATGKSTIQEIIAAQEFLYQEFPHLHRTLMPRPLTQTCGALVYSPLASPGVCECRICV